MAVLAVTRPGDRACKSGRAVLLAPGIVSPRKDHSQERSLRSRPSDGAACHSWVWSSTAKTRHLSGGRGRSRGLGRQPSRPRAAPAHPWL